ncbi:MAG: transposase [Saprospiraceae bacterium]
MKQKNRKNIRWRTWDYRWDGAYFITICTANQEHFFGKIENKKMILSPAGALADIFWHEIPKHAIGVTLDAFVVMPNHIHGIIILKNETEPLPVKPRAGEPDIMRSPDELRFQRPGVNSISTMVGGYKSVVTKHINRLELQEGWGWQGRFYDKVIRSEQMFNRIQNYILTNIENWDDDCFYS